MLVSVWLEKPPSPSLAAPSDTALSAESQQLVCLHTLFAKEKSLYCSTCVWTSG